ncbi:hypothetical protein BDZ89DRAFT_1163812 [Hymenopellis radicata]|nr:hypothetical protein BDZ89DRAFT_1163812 [Hymenopellis radicata]
MAVGLFLPFVALGAAALSRVVIQTNGVAGHMHEFYDLVKNTDWSGGDSYYSALEEVGSYWFNAMVPNSVLVNNTELILKTYDFLNYVLDETGWLGPEVGTEKPRFLWMADVDPSLTDQVVNATNGQILSRKMDNYVTVNVRIPSLVPSWVSDGTFALDDEQPKPMKPVEGLLGVYITPSKRHITLALPSRISIDSRPNNSVAIHRGPLNYAFDIERTETRSILARRTQLISSSILSEHGNMRLTGVVMVKVLEQLQGQKTMGWQAEHRLPTG